MKNVINHTELITPEVYKVLLVLFSLIIFLMALFNILKYVKGETKLIKELVDRTNSW